MVQNRLDDNEKNKFKITRIWFTYFILLYFSQKEIENAQTGKTNIRANCQMVGRVRPIDAVRSKCQANCVNVWARAPMTYRIFRIRNGHDDGSSDAVERERQIEKKKLN